MRPISSLRNPSAVSTPCFSNNSKARTVDRWRSFRLVVLIPKIAAILYVSHTRSLARQPWVFKWLHAGCLLAIVIR
jgi:hypothetical protein